MFMTSGLLLCLLWCAVDIVAVNRGFGLNTKQSIIAGMSLFAVQMIGVLCGGGAVALVAEPIVRHFYGNSEATIGISLLTAYASVPVFTYLVGLWWLKQYQLPRMEKSDRLRPLQKSLSPNSRNPNTGFRLFSFQIPTDSTQIPP